MEQFIIEGGHPLFGTIKVAGNKNAVLKMIPGCILTDEPVTLTNVPNIGDVRITIEIMRRLGVDIEWKDATSLHIHAKTIKTTTIDADLARKIRASVVFAG